MKLSLKPVATKLKAKKAYIIHWLAVLGLAGALAAMISAEYGNKDENLKAAYANKQLVAFDLETGLPVDAAVITTKPEQPKAKKGDKGAHTENLKKAEVMLVVANLGASKAETDKAIALPKQAILSFSPYADGVTETSQAAYNNGHIILLELPVATGGQDNAGNLALSIENSDFRNNNNLDAALSRIFNPAGVLVPANDVFSKSSNFVPVLNYISNKRLFLVYGGEGDEIDLKAKENDVELLKVDALLDEGKTSQTIPQQLASLEALARKTGFIIVMIKNPSVPALEQIDKWTGSLPAKNISLVAESSPLEKDEKIPQTPVDEQHGEKIEEHAPTSEAHGEAGGEHADPAEAAKPAEEHHEPAAH